MTAFDGDYRVVLPYAVYGISIKGGMVTDAAPIARWAIGKHYGDFARWVRGKDGHMEKSSG